MNSGDINLVDARLGEGQICLAIAVEVAYIVPAAHVAKTVRSYPFPTVKVEDDWYNE